MQEEFLPVLRKLLQKVYATKWEDWNDWTCIGRDKGKVAESWLSFVRRCHLCLFNLS
jgi:hypothetical protein